METTPFQTALDYFHKGGPVMGVLALCSVLAVAVFVERLWTMRSGRVVPSALITEVLELVRGDKLPEAIARAVGSGTAVGNVMAAMLRVSSRAPAELKERAQEVGRREGARFERFVELVGVVAALGPLLGLLGTVLGMIKVFQKVNALGAGSPVEMAAGIWEALVATAMGLLVGIPALVMYRVLLARADALVLRLEDEADALLELLTRR